MVEFVVEGTPRSQQTSSDGKAEWKRAVAGSAEVAMQTKGAERIEYVDISVRILHFCFDWADTAGDLDNIAKPIIDAMSLVVFFNDNQVRELFLRRTDLAQAEVLQIEGATPLLAARLELALSKGSGGFVYIAVHSGIDHRSLT